MMAGTDDKQEPVDEAVMSAAETGEVEMPYSIYSGKEKWLIVGMVGLAGFYRYVSVVLVLAASEEQQQVQRFAGDCQDEIH
jgi:hypothetical protein